MFVFITASEIFVIIVVLHLTWYYLTHRGLKSHIEGQCFAPLLAERRPRGGLRFLTGGAGIMLSSAPW